MFNKIKALVEHETYKKLKCICTDNGSKYLRPFDAYCQKRWIRYYKSLKLNGVAERMNKTLVERFNRLFWQARLPQSF